MSHPKKEDNTSDTHAFRLIEAMQAALCVVSDPVLILDYRAPQVLEANPSACALVRLPRAEVRNATVFHLLRQIGLENLLPLLSTLPLTDGTSWEFPWHNPATNVWIRWQVLVPSPGNDQIVTVVGCPSEFVPHDPSAPQQPGPFPSLRVDPLTGLPDRAAFEDCLAKKCVPIHGLRQECFAVLFIDLDRFKGVNDRLGHRHGDRVLRNMAQRLRAAVRPGDFVARFGGDEFTVLLDAVQSLHDAVGVAQRLLTVTASAPHESPNAEPVSMSVGIALGHAGMIPPNLIDAADRAMYRVKAAGGAGWAVAEREEP